MRVTHSTSNPVEETIHGVLVRDPYRWLEDRRLPETERWIREQQQHCEQYFSERDDMDVIRSRVRKHLDIPGFDQPTRVHDLCFYRYRSRGQQQPCIYVLDGTSREQRLLVNAAGSGAFASPSIYRVSRDGSLLAYTQARGGSDRRSVHVVSVANGVAMADPLQMGYTRGLVFAHDLSGYFYCHEQTYGPAEHVIRRRFFDDRSDEIVFKVPASTSTRLMVIGDDSGLGAVWTHQTEDGEYVEDLWTAGQGTALEWQSMFKNRRLPFRLVLKESRLFAISYDAAPNGKVVELNQNGSEKRAIVPHSGLPIRQTAFLGDSVFTCYASDRTSSIRCWNLQGEEIVGPPVPDGMTASLLPAYGPTESLFFSCESFDRPTYISEYIPSRGVTRPWPDAPQGPRPECVEVKRATYPSFDGTDIPITLVRRKNLPEQAPKPVIMTSYGAFGVPSTPQFSVLVSILLDQGFSFVLPHIRGGSELGAEWHRAGRSENKRTTFEDFIAAAVWLKSKGISDPKRLAIFGGSSSGLLVSVAMIQRPDLFRAVLCIAPLIDMVRYEMFDRARKWKGEYGSCGSEREFHVLHSYSPYHQLRLDRAYPSVLFVTGDQDDRCNPAHARKMAAAMLSNPKQTQPVLVDYCEQRGHSPNLPLDLRVEALARRIAFLLHELEVPLGHGSEHDRAGM